MSKFVAFDLELAEPIADGGQYDNQPISIAALYHDGVSHYFEGIPSMDKIAACKMVNVLKGLAKRLDIVTWNGLKFDWAVLAKQSGMVEECARLALEHYDLMAVVTFTKGYYLSLQTACVGMGLPGKKHEVTLKDGTVITEMGGALAPEMWQKGEYDAVKTYLHEDVRQLHLLTDAIVSLGALTWRSKSGNPQRINLHSIPNCSEMFNIPSADTSWMADPPTRASFVEWIPRNILSEYGIPYQEKML